jgi:hypothetical protein
MIEWLKSFVVDDDYDDDDDDYKPGVGVSASGFNSGANFKAQ